MTWLLGRIRISALLLAALVLAGPGILGALQIPVVIATLGVVAAAPPDAQSVQEFLKTYEETMASGRVASIVKLYVDSDARQQAVLDDYFRNVISDLVVRLDDVDIAVDGDRAQVSFDRTDSFIDRKSGNRVEKTVEVERQLRRDGKGWRIELAG